jgi:hypothetical protein
MDPEIKLLHLTTMISLRTLGISEKKNNAKKPATPPKAPKVIPLNSQACQHNLLFRIRHIVTLPQSSNPTDTYQINGKSTYSLVALLRVIPPTFGAIEYLYPISTCSPSPSLFSNPRYHILWSIWRFVGVVAWTDLPRFNACRRMELRAQRVSF